MNKRIPKVDPALVRELFDYADGVLYWREAPARQIPAGSVAGCLRKGRATCTINIRGKCYPRPHIVWAWHYGKWPGACVRHLNDDSHDDRIENLVAETFFERAIRIRNLVAGTPGAKHEGNGRWSSSISIGSRPYHLGTFDSEEAAHEAFKQAHVAVHGDDSPYATGADKC
ncbi:MAG: HNH endonuclease [Propionivibrio sp.]